MTRKADFFCICIAAVTVLFSVSAAMGAQARPVANKPKAAAQAAAARTAPAETVSEPRSLTAPPRILVLPFQINAGPQMDRLNDELPLLLARSIEAKGMAVVPEREIYALLRSEKISSFNLQIVRDLAGRLKADAAVYGSYNQVGDAFSIDTRLVEGGDSKTVKPLFVERNKPTDLVSAVEDLAGRIALEISRRDVLAGVEVRGTKVLDPDVVLLRLNTRKGDHVDMEAIDREMRRIWDLGYFSDVSALIEPREEGLVLVYRVQEKPRIESVLIEGAKDVSQDDILAAMSTKNGTVLNEKLLAQDLQKILELFRKDGYYLATVDHRIDAGAGGAGAALVLTVVEGEKLYIKKVKIDGCTQLKESDVKDEMVLTERGMFSWFTGSGVLKEELFDRDAAAIGVYYMNNGFMDIEVGAPKVEYEKDGIVITFPIQEGTRYRVNEVGFDGDLIDTDERLREVIQFDDIAKKKGYFNLAAAQDDVKSLTAYYAEYGYAFAEVSPVPAKTEKEGYVNMVYRVEKKQKVYIRRAIIEGNVRTRDNVILRELRLTDGDQFIGSKLQRSKERLDRLDYFEVADTELVPTQKEEEFDLKIKVKEKSTGALMGGFGYSTYSSFGVSGTLMERNLWGKGYATSLQAMFSGMHTAYTYSFTNPRFNDTNLAIGLDLYILRDDFIDYLKNTTGGILRFSYPLGEYTSLGWSYRLDTYRLYDIAEDASSLIRDYEGNRLSSAAVVRITRDTTDHMRPTTGTINRIGVEYGGGLLGGDDDFIKLVAEHQTYIKLYDNHILHTRVRGSALFPNGSGVPPVFERFWMGGIENVRGYDSRELVPRDPKTNDHLGGTRMAFANFEYIYTIAPQIGVNLVPFFDIGFNYDDRQPLKWDKEIKKSVGLELRWRSPMGDLRFAYGFPLDPDRRNHRNTTGRFEFSMGQFF